MFDTITTLTRVAACVFDFDNTLFDTSAKGSEGIGVSEAYVIAFTQVLGVDAGAWLEEYGLRNRAPAEVVQALYDERPWLLAGHSVTACANRVVKAKLSCLERQISSQWPAPCGSALEHLAWLLMCDIPVAILSSGHQSFIEKVFEARGMTTPELLTDDDLRGRPGDPLQWVKPSGILFTLLREKWERREASIVGQPASAFLYVGDDPIKDGGLARNSGMQFALFDPTGKKRRAHPGAFSFSDWHELQHQIEGAASRMA